MNSSNLAYISFDVVPAPKGAAIHIEAFTQVLAENFGDLKLVTVSPTTEGSIYPQHWPNIDRTELPALGSTLIHRILHFRSQLENWLSGQYFRAIHIRSIYEGFPIALDKQKYCQNLIFEVNGMPSIELKYRYPDIAGDRELLHKLITQEQVCLEAADLIITPSSVTRNYLISRKIPPQKIRVIPNGVNLEIFQYSPPQSLTSSSDMTMRAIYFGTLSLWQGVDLAVRAIALSQADFPVRLQIIGQGSKRQIQALKHLIAKLGITKQVTYLEPLSQENLVAQIHFSHAILVPLTINDRNLVQGCCPFKVLEGMATGTPVIASNLPVVRELGEDRKHFYLIKPGSVVAIEEALSVLRQHPELRKQLAETARQHIENRYTWEHSGAALLEAYQELGIVRFSEKTTQDKFLQSFGFSFQRKLG